MVVTFVKGVGLVALERVVGLKQSVWNIVNVESINEVSIIPRLPAYCLRQAARCWSGQRWGRALSGWETSPRLKLSIMSSCLWESGSS